jgi:hypothetical protein
VTCAGTVVGAAVVVVIFGASAATAVVVVVAVAADLLSSLSLPPPARPAMTSSATIPPAIQGHLGLFFGAAGGYPCGGIPYAPVAYWGSGAGGCCGG